MVESKFDKLKKQLSEEKKEEKRKKVNARNLKYQNNSSHYKKYRRDKWKQSTYDDMKNYIENHTDDDIDDIMSIDDSIGEMRRQFRKRYGDKVYFKYISPQQKNIYKIMSEYINEHTDDKVKSIIDKEDTPSILRRKFKLYYGDKIYFKYISDMKKK